MVGVLVFSALFALTVTAFIRFSSSVLKVAANQEKKGAMASADSNLRALLGNRLSCLATVSQLSYSATTEQRPVTIFERMTTGGVARAAYSEGNFLHGVAIRELGALVGPDVRSARRVRIRVLLEKIGDGIHETKLEQSYYLHVLMNLTTPAECYLLEGPTQLSMIKAEDVTIPATVTASGGRAATFVSNPPNQPNPRFGPPGWETHATHPIPASGCQYGGENGAPPCPSSFGPPSAAITAQGNRLVYSFQSRVSMGIGGAVIGGGFPPSYPFYLVGSTAPVPSPPYYRMDPMGFAAKLVIRLLTGTTAIEESVFSVSDWFGNFGFIQTSITTALLEKDVNYGTSYTFGLGYSSEVAVMSPQPVPVPPPPPPPPALPPPPMPPAYSFYFINYLGAQGTVFHYVTTPALP